MVRTQNFQSPAALVIGMLGSVTGPRGSGTNAKLYLVQPRVLVVHLVVVRTQNVLSPAARGIGPRGSGTNAKFS